MNSIRLRWLISVGLFVGVAIAYASMVSDWGFNADDYAAVHMGNVSSWHDLTAFFSSKPNEFGASPSNIRETMPHGFFDVSFRPLTMLVVYVGESLLLGVANPYRYFVVASCLHAAAVAVAFNFFLLLVPWYLALSAALFFAFHASLGLWFGALSEQTFMVCAILLMIALYWLITSIVMHQNWRYVGSVLLVGLALFFHECAWGAPLWATIALLYCFLRDGLVAGGPIARCGKYAWLPYIIVLVLYFFCRYLVYPISSGGAVFDPASILIQVWLKVRCFDFVTLVVDALGLAWLPAGHMVVKSILLALVMSGVVFIWWRSPWRREATLLFMGAILLAWPSFILLHKGRYIYAALPWFVAMLLLCVRETPRWHYVMTAMLCGLAVVGFWHNRYCIQRRATALCFIRSTFDQLASSYRNCSQPLCFLGMPTLWFDEHGTAQALWLRWERDEPPIYVDARLGARTPADDQLTSLPIGELMAVSHYDGNVRFESLDHSQVWFPSDEGKTSLGEKKRYDVVETKFGRRAYAYTIALDQRWLQKKPLLLTWDFVHNGVVELP